MQNREVCEGELLDKEEAARTCSTQSIMGNQQPHPQLDADILASVLNLSAGQAIILRRTLDGVKNSSASLTGQQQGDVRVLDELQGKAGMFHYQKEWRRRVNTR